MESLHFPASACRYCRFYAPEGRRGGTCQQLGVPVAGTWKACSLALPPFAPTWETVEQLPNFPELRTAPDTLSHEYREYLMGQAKIPRPPVPVALK